MKRQAWVSLFIVFLLVGVTAVFLARFKQHQRLGAPGVKLVSVPLHDETNRVISQQSIYLPDRSGQAVAELLPVDSVTVQTLPRDTTYGRKIYRWPDGFEVLLNAVLMGTDRSSIHKPQLCLAGQGWQIDPARSRVVQVPFSQTNAQKLSIMLLTSRNQSQPGLRGLFAYWFVTAQATTPHHGERIRSMGWKLLTQGELERWAYISAFVVCGPEQEGAALERLLAFLGEVVPQIQTGPGGHGEPRR
jgi:hypothetical protein